MLTTILLITLLFGCSENRNVCDGGSQEVASKRGGDNEEDNKSLELRITNLANKNKRFQTFIINYLKKYNKNPMKDFQHIYFKSQTQSNNTMRDDVENKIYKLHDNRILINEIKIKEINCLDFYNFLTVEFKEDSDFFVFSNEEEGNLLASKWKKLKNTEFNPNLDDFDLERKNFLNEYFKEKYFKHPITVFLVSGISYKDSDHEKLLNILKKDKYFFGYSKRKEIIDYFYHHSYESDCFSE